jgi:type I restriction enzyme S subunit
MFGKGEIVVHIYSKNFKEMKFPLPPLHEQHQIVEYLDKETKLIDETISSEQKKIELLKEYKQSLISEVITGKRKVVN